MSTSDLEGGAYRSVDDSEQTSNSPKWYWSSSQRFKETTIQILIIGTLNVILALGMFTYLISNPTTSSIDINDNSRLPKSFQQFQKPISPIDASTIFNSVHNVMRVKPSLLHPVGVTFIPAYIPEGTLLYHGTMTDLQPGLDWIAMDPEFSYWFIANRGGPKGKPRKGPFRKPGGGHTTGKGFHGPGKKPKQHLPAHDHPSLFTLEVVKPLDKLIIFDGASAAKKPTGEMDSQVILSRGNENMGEIELAERICDWGKPFGLDGFIRLEVSFEAVLCDMTSDKVRVVNNVTIPWKEDIFEKDKGLDIFNEIDSFGGFEQLQFGANHDLGDHRVVIDFRGLVTPVNKTWISPDPYMRRFANISEDLQDSLILDLENHFSKHRGSPYSGTNWQLVTDEIVKKFAPLLKILNQTYSREYTNDEEYEQSLRTLTIFTTNFARRFHFIDDPEEARRQALYQYTHPYQNLQTESDVLIWSSITEVTGIIVDLIFDIFEFSKTYINTKEKDEEGYLRNKSKLQEVLQLLNWTEFIGCTRKCGWDEICYTPSWGPSPIGWDSTVGAHFDVNGRIRANEEQLCINYRNLLL